MAFSSIPFLCVFFPVTAICYYTIPSIKAKNFFLIAVSLMFYAYGEGQYVILMTACAFFNYVMARLISACARTKKLLLSMAVLADLGMLGVYKYAGMAVTTINDIFGSGLKVPDIRLPIGVSFFAFQAMSYVIDVYRGKARADRSFLKILLYISFFPQLIAGPIIKYHSISEQIDSRETSLRKMRGGICAGLRRFIVGLSKKVLLSDAMAVAADYVFSLGYGELGMAAAWLGAVSYMLQIYFDFSGYSDMAVGMGKMFGFDFPENFQYPYAAGSIRNFWRRWHISLTDWFREYLYIPLGGNREGMARTWLNQMVVFFCTGLWHGADWTFVLWGLYHGMFVVFETVLPERKKGFRILRHLYVLVVVCVGFVIFRADTIGQAAIILEAMFTRPEWNARIAAATLKMCDNLFVFSLAAAVICAMPLGRGLQAWCRRRVRHWHIVDGAGYAGSVILLLACMMSLAGGTFHPFIYFRF